VTAHVQGTYVERRCSRVGPVQSSHSGIAYASVGYLGGHSSVRFRLRRPIWRSGGPGDSTGRACDLPSRSMHGDVSTGVGGGSFSSPTLAGLWSRRILSSRCRDISNGPNRRAIGTRSQPAFILCAGVNIRVELEAGDHSADFDISAALQRDSSPMDSPFTARSQPA